MNRIAQEQEPVSEVDEAVQAEPKWAGKAMSLPQLRLDAGRAAILSYFENTWALTETLFSALTCADAYYRRPYHGIRHPLIFYYVHPVTFYINKLRVAGLLKDAVNPHFEVLFETGVDEMNWDDLHAGDQNVWPALDQVQAYRRQVYEIVKEFILNHPALDQPISMSSPEWALVMCFEHERIHLETSSVLMRELPAQFLRQPESWPVQSGLKSSGRFSKPAAGVDYPALNPLLPVMEQTVMLGKPEQWPGFGWDNEYGSERHIVPSFRAGKMLISNGEFYEFVSSGAYLEEKYWSSAGWDWRRFRNTRWPSFWVQDGPVGSHHYKLRTVFNVQDMQWDWPVVVNHYEAKAYCVWRSEKDGVIEPYRLLKEQEHLALHDPEIHQAAEWQPGSDQLLWHDAVMSDQTNSQNINHNLQYGSEGPVDGFRANDSGFHDVQGNLWQWSEDTFQPLSGFRVHPFYADFSTPCFDNQHQRILGSSFISTGNEASIWSRFHFRPHFFQHAGFRLAQGDETALSENKYESDSVLNQYMLFHWGSMAEQRDQEISSNVGHPDTNNFILTVAQLLRKFSVNKRVALDLGCAVGRASFELAEDFNQVIGLDYSLAFVEAAKTMQTEGAMKYHRHESGRYSTELNAQADPKIDRNKICFLQGDAGDLQAAGVLDLVLAPHKSFDAVLLSNLLCRLPDPAACLQQFTGDDSFLADDGVLLIASPNSWMEQYTSPQAFLDAPHNTETLKKLGSLLPGFELLHQQDLPFMIREHRRKYEYVVSQVSVWKKTAGK
jgi:5-histidylcysteine sulfoxide synthase/putative 4-mercaptohistidine N1-methyltranferase